MELLRPLIAERPPEERDKIEAAYEFAREAHEGVARKSGEPYITHPVAVAKILAELGMDTDAISAGLLHDTVEDVERVTFAVIEAQFGPDVRKIVEGETKVSKLTKLSANLHDQQSENLRQMLIAMTGDVRIIIVKLADRLHNMRTLASMKPEKQQRIARETIEIFAPLAHRLGIGQIKWELEDLSFTYLDPQAYSYLETRLRTRQEERDAQITQAIEQLRAELADDIELSEWVQEEDISGRSKHLWSIHQKMQKEGKALEQIFDLLAIRLILTPKPVNAPESRQKERAEEAREKRVCYHSLGIVHSMWSPIPGRFKDYIAVPKPNGYQSLHTTVISQGGQPIEVQIRSKRMHMVAEFGIAAHWMYKQGSALAQKERDDWLLQMRDLQRDFSDAADFVDAVKNDILGGRVFVFTPRGDTVSLPQGATPVDFAYHIHSRIGDTTIGSRVNGSIVSLSHKLKNGDMVEIVTNKNSTPSRDWLNFATTRSARSKIRHHFRILERSEALQNGHDLLEKHLRKRQLPVRQLMRTKILEDVSFKLAGSRNPDDLYLAIHAGKLTPGAVARALAPQLEQEQRPLRAPAPRPVEPGGVYVEGFSTVTKLANCCTPIRGDQIMGYLTRGRGVTVHRIDCPNMVRLLKFEPERCVAASWNPGTRGNAIVDVDVVAADRSGLLSDVLGLLVSLKHSPMKVSAGVGADSVAHIALRLAVENQAELVSLANQLRQIESVTDVLRVGKGNKSVPRN
ncbi:bifunctional (p)ppGpp synthetase/guanosine-3',5'-bis(diphosphate) 3'-pyrophosphohydrolase [Deinococcus psychrotolerans]|uniref:Bifunctional (P)ppGpp synthetase/guanosine-3',5'-bis(Diphosphate) 3'-pyrophosphohydrolase n=1 Tax=Deinococcus psychrotolerans TaxID=2489213 RepID=A0A3G8YLL9_9DEIO|nr:bifunctional (p)ppGpp synthetase/guanosine-3',5'-bis(diphosphate) 3'-pyrophosphohydrolase [Deinococcus psychrotolerans]AZI42511.1 bifunctional (p)ppGpp synthetase/guanosine-3',5'-bis(diphosphate) 3'-pyrophosphohydrolase [Deinococcus psychrotolerans]